MRSSFRFRDLFCFVDPDDARRYYILPSTPDVRRGADERPMITMVDVAGSGYVMFTATWAARPATVDALRREIAAGQPGADANGITLAFAPLASLQCHTVAGDRTGSFQTIATSATSGVPPYDALFNLAVQGERLTQVRRALSGERGLLGIEYVADVLVRSTSTATFRAPASELLPWLRSGRAASLRALLELAIASGLATVTVDPADHAGAAAAALVERVLDDAAQRAPRWLADAASGDIEVSVTLERDGPEPVRAFADIGGLIADRAVRP
jgi:hypothetical protein